MEILAEAVKLFIGDKEILRGLDFHLKPKEFLGIIGPNGSGKSMFLKCLYRVQKPTAGSITMNGRTLDELSYRESALQLAVVAQHNVYSFDFTVMGVVLMGAPRTSVCSTVTTQRTTASHDTHSRRSVWQDARSAALAASRAASSSASSLRVRSRRRRSA